MLQEEGVNSSYFSSSYFITLFTQTMQHQQTNEKMWKLLRIWDYFIIVSDISIAQPLLDPLLAFTDWS